MRIRDPRFGCTGLQIRRSGVMLDFELAEMYETETKRLKEVVRRNIDRFPEDFMFELTRDEYNTLRTQIASLEKGKGKHSKFNPQEAVLIDATVSRHVYTRVASVVQKDL